MDIIIGVVSAAVTIIGVVYTIRTRTDKLLIEIRDVLIEIRDKP